MVTLNYTINIVNKCSILFLFSDFLDQDSTHAINVDSKTYNHVKLNLNNPSYNTFDEAQVGLPLHLILAVLLSLVPVETRVTRLCYLLVGTYFSTYEDR